MSQIPTDLWVYISSFINAWETNPFLFLKCSHISKAARMAFLRPSLWQPLNPARAPDPAAHFIATLETLSPQKRSELRLVWQHSVFVYTHGSLEKSDLLMYKIIRNELPKPFMENVYYQLGLMVSTAFSVLRPDTMPLPISDPHLLRCAVRIMPHNWARAVPSLKRDRGLALAAVSTPFPECNEVDMMGKVDGYVIHNHCYAPINNPEFLCDKEFAKTATRVNWRYLQNVAIELQTDYDFMRDVLSFHPSLYCLCPPELILDRQARLNAVQRDPELMLVIVDHLVDREVLMAAYNGCKSTKRNVEFKRDGSEVISVPPVVKRVGELLKSLGLTNDKELFMRLVTWSGLFLQFASAKLKADTELLETAVSSDGAALDYIDLTSHSEQYRVKLFLSAIGTRPDILCYYPDYRNNAKIVYAATKEDGIGYVYASNALRQDKALYRLAMKTNPIAASVAPRALVSEQDLITLAQTHPRQAARAGRLNTKPLIMASLAACPQNPAPIDKEFRNDRDIVLGTVKLDGLQFLKLDRLKRDRQIAFAAVSQNSGILDHLLPFLGKPEFELMYKLRAGWQIMQHALDLRRREFLAGLVNVA